VKGARKLAAITVVAAVYGGNMDEELANELLNDMDFHYNKVKCRKVDQLLPKLMKMVEGDGRDCIAANMTRTNYKDENSCCSNRFRQYFSSTYFRIPTIGHRERLTDYYKQDKA
jgi:hypothetical protein